MTGYYPRWKQVENEICRLYGVRRRPLSGGGRGPKSDCEEHPTLVFSMKKTDQPPTKEDWVKVAKEGHSTGKIPVLIWWPPRERLRKVMATMRLGGLMRSFGVRVAFPLEAGRVTSEVPYLLVQVRVVDHARLVRGKP